MTGEVPAHEITLALRRREPEPACVLRRPEGCSHCWPCKKAAAEDARREARRERVAKFRALLRLRRG